MYSNREGGRLGGKKKFKNAVALYITDEQHIFLFLGFHQSSPDVVLLAPFIMRPGAANSHSRGKKTAPRARRSEKIRGNCYLTCRTEFCCANSRLCKTLPRLLSCEICASETFPPFVDVETREDHDTT
jgi:hypothetical protein